MTIASPEILIGLTIVLLFLALGLVLFLVRAFRKSAAVRTSRRSSVESAYREDDSARRLTVTQTAPASDPAVTSADSIAASQTDARFGEMAPETRVKASPRVAQPSEPSPEPSDMLLMKVWQDREGFLAVDVEGQRYRRLFDIRDGEVGRRVLDTIHRLVGFSKGQRSYKAPLSAPEEAIEEQARRVIDRLKQNGEPQPRKARITMDPVPFRRPGAAQEHGLTLNLAAEVDQLLQVRVAASPELSQRAIRVTNAPDGTLWFEIDGISYDALDKITETEVRALIRAAIADWEAQR